jgi:hypothetical protein
MRAGTRRLKMPEKRRKGLVSRKSKSKKHNEEDRGSRKQGVERAEEGGRSGSGEGEKILEGRTSSQISWVDSRAVEKHYDSEF